MSAFPFINMRKEKADTAEDSPGYAGASRLAAFRCCTNLLARLIAVSYFKGISVNIISAIFIASMLLSEASFAETLKSEADLQKLSDGVMQSVSTGNLAKAFEKMKPYVVISSNEFDGFSLSSKAQRDQFGIRYGRTIGYEFISNKKVGQSLVKITYIEKTEKHALPWSFYFYKTTTGWVLNSFSWDDKFPLLFLTE